METEEKESVHGQRNRKVNRSSVDKKESMFITRKERKSVDEKRGKRMLQETCFDVFVKMEVNEKIFLVR